MYLAEACGHDQDVRRDAESLALREVGVVTSNAVNGRPALATGTLMGIYRIVEQIGAGGMGEVYRAHDAKLRRDVALKVLPQALAADRDRLARLEQEARVLAALNHANIAHVYGLEEFNGTRAVVMELIEGDTLADRIARGPIAFTDALAIAGQIAAALTAAHDQGIIHRDLKPANVKLRSDGTVKVLDFGLAKVLRVGEDSTATEPGSMVGTAAYMSPEQASGKPVDRRADLWAFGAVLMEMLTGRRVFDGASVPHVFSAVLTSEPNWSTLPEGTPLPVRRLLTRCLAKEPARRLDSAAAARLDLDEATGKLPESVAASAPSPRMSRREVFAWTTAAALGIVAVTVPLAVSAPRPAIAPLPEIAFEIQSVRSVVYGDDPGFAVSPDGTRIAFVAANEGRSQLFVRALNDVSATPVPGTAEASWPFWSPDSKSIGFVAYESLKRVDLTGGEPEPIGSAGDLLTFRGATWTRADEIVFSSSISAPLLMIRATGGDVRPLTRPSGAGDRQPFVLPDGRHLLFTRSGPGAE